MIALGTPLPAFALPDAVSGRVVTSEALAGSPALLVAFLCNHCPYVKHILEGFVAFAHEYQARGLAVVAISSNDAAAYPDDGPQEMAGIARRLRFGFPYLFDESQGVALSFEAICTPDFFLFDAQRRLAYRGQFDASRPNGMAPVTGSDLRAAADAVLTDRAIAGEQLPSVGCSIKWRAGNEPAWG